MAKFAITKEERKYKTVILEADNLDEAIDIAENADIDLYEIDSEVSIYKSLYANPDGTATEEQVNLCEEI